MVEYTKRFFNDWKTLMSFCIWFHGLQEVSCQLPISYDDHMYVFYSSSVTWSQASTSCQDIGLRLASMDTDAEFQYWRHYLTTVIGEDTAWVGARYNFTENDFVWLYTGKLVPVEYFRSPDFTYNSKTDRACACFHQHKKSTDAYQINLARKVCTGTRYYLCEENVHTETTHLTEATTRSEIGSESVTQSLSSGSHGDISKTTPGNGLAASKIGPSDISTEPGTERTPGDPTETSPSVSVDIGVGTDPLESTPSETPHEGVSTTFQISSGSTDVMHETSTFETSNVQTSVSDTENSSADNSNSDSGFVESTIDTSTTAIVPGENTSTDINTDTFTSYSYSSDTYTPLTSSNPTISSSSDDITTVDLSTMENTHLTTPGTSQSVTPPSSISTPLSSDLPSTSDESSTTGSYSTDAISAITLESETVGTALVSTLSYESAETTGRTITLQSETAGTTIAPTLSYESAVTTGRTNTLGQEFTTDDTGDARTTNNVAETSDVAISDTSPNSSPTLPSTPDITIHPIFSGATTIITYETTETSTRSLTQSDFFISTTGSQFIPQASPNREAYCFCPCPENITDKDASLIEEEIKKIQKELIINKRKVSSAYRKKVCAEDNRPSAQGVGYMGVFLIFIAILFVTAQDITVTVFWVISRCHCRYEEKLMQI